MFGPTYEMAAGSNADTLKDDNSNGHTFPKGDIRCSKEHRRNHYRVICIKPPNPISKKNIKIKAHTF